MTFSPAALAEAGQDRTERSERCCPSCNRPCLYYAFEYAGPPNERWEFVSCNACRSNPARTRWVPRQPRLLRLEV